MTNGRGATVVALALVALGLGGCGQAMMSAKLTDYEKAYDASLWLETEALPPATAGKAYAARLVARGEPAPYRWRVVGGALPAGVSLDGARGVLQGTPAAAGSCSFVIEVATQKPNAPDEDARKPYIAARTRRLTLEVAGAPEPAPALTPASLTPAN